MALGDPWGHDGKTYDGKEMRQLVDAMFAQTGVIGDNDFLVEQQSSPNATVKVRAGGLVIAATGAGLFGKYQQSNDASINSGSFAPTSTNGRKDRLILRITSGVGALEIVQGTASGSPAEPTITGDNYEELALITMPGSTTNITTAMITDRRNHATATGAVLRARGASYPYPLYSARAYRASALTVSAAVAGTLIAMDTESWDYNNNFDTATGKYTAPVTAIYQVDGAASVNANSNPDEYELNIYVNASLRASGTRAVIRGATGGDDFNFVVSELVALTAGDLLDLRIDHLQGGNSAALNGGSNHSYLSIFKV